MIPRRFGWSPFFNGVTRVGKFSAITCPGQQCAFAGMTEKVAMHLAAQRMCVT
jgi:hypothetical protein